MPRFARLSCRFLSVRVHDKTEVPCSEAPKGFDGYPGLLNDWVIRKYLPSEFGCEFRETSINSSQQGDAVIPFSLYRDDLGRHVSLWVHAKRHVTGPKPTGSLCAYERALQGGYRVRKTDT